MAILLRWSIGRIPHIIYVQSLSEQVNQTFSHFVRETFGCHDVDRLNTKPCSEVSIWWDGSDWLLKWHWASMKIIVLTYLGGRGILVGSIFFINHVHAKWEYIVSPFNLPERNYLYADNKIDEISWLCVPVNGRECGMYISCAVPSPNSDPYPWKYHRSMLSHIMSHKQAVYRFRMKTTTIRQ